MTTDKTTTTGTTPATFTFAQIEAACGVLRQYGDDSVRAYEDATEVYEIDYLERITVALGVSGDA